MTFTHTTAVPICSICVLLLLRAESQVTVFLTYWLAVLTLFLFVAVWSMDDFYTYIQTCINICFTIQNGWEDGNIIRFLCLSNLVALFTGSCYFLFYEWGSLNGDITFSWLACGATMMIRRNTMFNLRWRMIGVYDRIDQIGTWDLVDIKLNC